MTPGAGRGKLYLSLKELRRRWELTEPGWQDVVRQQFEDKLLTPLDEHTAAALRGIDRLTQVLVQMRQECEGSVPTL